MSVAGSPKAKSHPHVFDFSRHSVATSRRIAAAFCLARGSPCSRLLLWTLRSMVTVNVRSRPHFEHLAGTIGPLLAATSQ